MQVDAGVMTLTNIDVFAAKFLTIGPVSVITLLLRVKSWLFVALSPTRITAAPLQLTATDLTWT